MLSAAVGDIRAKVCNVVRGDPRVNVRARFGSVCASVQV